MEVTRTCIGCRGKAPKSELARFVRGADGALVWDERRRLPGRGAYVHPAEKCWELASKRRAFGRALRSDVKVGQLPAALVGRPA